MSTPTQLLEDAIVALIAGVVTSGADIEALPENAAEYERVIDTPKIWVALNHIQGNEEKSASNIYQPRTFRFEIMLKALTLRGDLGIYNLYDLCSKALMGKRPLAGCGWMKMLQLQSNGVKDQVKDYSFYVEFPGLPIVENLDTTSGDGPLLQQLEIVQN